MNKADDESMIKSEHMINGLVQIAKQFFKKMRDVLMYKTRFHKFLNNQYLISRKDKK